MYEDEIIFEHFDVPDCFDITIKVMCDDNHTVKCVTVNNTNECGSSIDQSYSKYGSKIGTIMECILTNVENVLEEK